MLKKTLMSVSLGAALITPGVLDASDDHHWKRPKKPFKNFVELRQSANSADWDPAAPWKLPHGFAQEVVSDESALNIYDDGRDD